MKITVVCDVYGRLNNGTDIVSSNLINQLRNSGHEVRVLCPNQDYIGVKDHYVVPNINFGKALNRYIAKVGVSIAKPDKTIIRESFEGVDCVHIMMPLTLGLAAAKVAKEMGLPITAGFHAQAENITAYLKMNRSGFANKLVYKIMYKHLYSFCDAIHYPTQFIRDVFEGAVKHTTPGFVISNGVHDYVQKRDVEKPEEYKDKFVILTTGRYATEKSQDTLIKAVARSRYKDKIQLILGGEGIKEKYYRRLAKKLPVQPLFRFFSREEIIDTLNYCDMYVHPAQMELEGIACIEAIACGKLTIVSDSKKSATKGFAIDDSCIFRSRCSKDLARVLDYWIEHPDKKKEYEEKYLHSAVAFRQDECLRRLEQMILDAVETHKPKAEEHKTKEKN